MRISWIIACILLSAQAVSGQEQRDPVEFPPSGFDYTRAVLPEFTAQGPGIPLSRTEHLLAADRDPIAGAFYGAVMGAAVGGVGFAVLDNTRRSGREYFVVALLVGATIGGASGAVVGAILGAPTSREGH